MPDYILQIRINIKANDDPDARSKAEEIIKYNIYEDIAKASLREMRGNYEPRIVHFKPCLDRSERLSHGEN